MVLFILTEIIDLKHQAKTREKQKISVLIEFYPSLNINQNPHTRVI